MREAAQGGGEMAPPELVRTFYETVVSQHRLEDLPRFVEEGCVLRQGEWTTPLGPGGMVRHLAALRETYPDYTVRILRQHWARNSPHGKTPDLHRREHRPGGGRKDRGARRRCEHL